nr:hypothetical protein [Saprospiraceae bacterium]
MKNIPSLLLLALSIALFYACQSDAESTESHDVTQESHTEQTNEVNPSSTLQNGENNLTLTDQQLLEIGALNQEIKILRQDYNNSVSALIENHGLTLPEFQQQSRLMTTGSKSELTPQQQKVWRDINVQMMDIQMDLQSTIETKVAESGYTMEEFRSHTARINQHPEYKQRQNELQ